MEKKLKEEGKTISERSGQEDKVPPTHMTFSLIPRVPRGCMARS
jgi:hypothetical protein